MFNTNTPAKKEILFLSSYPPRACGIATYSQDLIGAIHNKFSSSFALRVCAVENDLNIIGYPQEVKYVLRQSDVQEYINLAHKINNDDAINMVFVQHEFGLFGGDYGNFLLQFLYELEKPVSVTFHTVLPLPDEKRRNIVKAIVAACDHIIVMTNNSSTILQADYGVSTDLISVIPHGTHIVEYKNKEELKKTYHLEDRLILSTFGLLSSNKSIETAIKALPAIVEKFPKVLYVILGKTHPGVVNHEGEIYRGFLEGLVSESGLQENVRFVNKYLDLPELLEYLSVTDVYLFTSKDPHQAVSGTFAYAMSSACPIISTPIPHAKEMMKENAGIVVDFQNSEQMAEATIRLLENDQLREEMGRNAFYQTRANIWENVAGSHAKLFHKYFSTKEVLTYDLPQINLKHVKLLTDEIGMIQFSKFSDPDVSSGYTLDDNARALIAVCQHYDLTKDFSDLDLIETYLNFIKRCQQPGGGFLNYVGKDGKFHHQNNYINLDDSNGRAIWALGVLMTYRQIIPVPLVLKAKQMLDASFNWVEILESPRAMAFVIKGFYFYYQTNNSEEIKELIDGLGMKLLKKYNEVADEKWAWYEEYLTYANSALPEALLYAFLTTGKLQYKMIAHISFEFLLSHTFKGNSINVVSNRGWHHKEKVPNKFGEQPIDVSYTIQTLALFYSVFKDEDYLKNIEIAFSWFLGNNHLNQIVYNPLTGGCFDGLEEHNVNLNQGAESTVCYLTARLVVEKIKIEMNEINMRVIQLKRKLNEESKLLIEKETPKKRLRDIRAL